MLPTDFFLKLLLEVQKFESSDLAKNSPTVDDFRKWLNNEKYRTESPTKLFLEENKNVAFVDNEICKQILLISRYARISIRRGLNDFPELANEEFTYLYRIKDEPGLTKMALIERNAHEKPTGMHIIRRLLDYELINEVADQSDKRSKLLYLTDKGQTYFDLSVPIVDSISQFLSGDLNSNEKTLLLNILIKLNTFHNAQYQRIR